MPSIIMLKFSVWRSRKKNAMMFALKSLFVLLSIAMMGTVQGEFTQDNNKYSYETFSCCSEVYGSCRTSCESLSLVHLASGINSKDSKLLEIKRYCPSMQTDFWACLNQTLQAISKGSQWSGRPCCALGMTERCQNTCAVAGSRHDLKKGCRQSDEQNLYSCLDRQENVDTCCSQSRSAECMQACKDIFGTRFSPTKDQKERLQNICEENNSEVLECIKNFTEEPPNLNLKNYIPCCDHASNTRCRRTCEESLSSSLTTQESIDALENGGCGPPLPHDPLWQCFMSTGRPTGLSSNSNEISRINQIGMDSAKLHCCHKSIAPKCRRLCLLTYSNDWTETRHRFEMDCLTKFNEPELRQCIDEVEEPCELGCDGLSFCTNFNARPTELFRSCNTGADMAARSDVTQWQSEGYITLPGFNLPIKNISKCSPETWKAVACTLQIKPCASNSHANQICREDCFNLLTECMDWTKLHGEGHSAASLCSKLSPAEKSTPCVSLKPFLEQSEFSYRTETQKIRSPCRGNPCNATQVCLIDSSHPNGYHCVTGCPLGEASPYLVPVNTYVRIPVSATQKGCLKICRCNESGMIDHCQPLPCITYDSCNLAGRTLEHGSWFYVECNICSCFAGEITCTKKQCRIPGVTDNSYTSLPCNCPPHFVPVCGKNGKTFPSACIAKCSGLQDFDFEYGPCQMTNACDNHDCPAHSVCVEDRQVCLSSMHRPCPQYQCVNATGSCKDHTPVCDQHGKTHHSLCHLVRSKAELAYHSACNRHCNMDHIVCGINGVTYLNECQAWSDYSMVDHFGPCLEVGLLSATMGPRCSTTKCPVLPSPHCQPIIPPGACCPVCSGSIRIVYSRKQIDRALYALKGENSELLTLKSLLRSLARLVKVSGCRLSGFLTIEADIFVTIQSAGKHPSLVQIEACNREAEKITNLIATQSHRITSELSLSALTVANMAQPEISLGIQSIQSLSTGLIIILMTFWLGYLRWI